MVCYWSGTMFIGPRRELKVSNSTKGKFQIADQKYGDSKQLEAEKEQYQKKLDFGVKLYNNLERVLEKQARKSFEKRITGQAPSYEFGMADSDPHATTDLDPMVFVNQMKELHGMQKNEHLGQKEAIDERKSPFNVLKWLRNESNIESDSEEDLQKLMKEERHKKEVDARKEHEKQIQEEDEKKKKKKSRIKRFFKWARDKLHL